MIDFISVSCPIDNISDYLEKSPLRWKAIIDNETGEVEKHTATYKNLSLSLPTGENCFLNIKNSLHSFWHGVNHTDFSISDICEVTEHLKNTLQVAPESMQIHSFEFGVNIELAQIPPEIFKHYLSYRGENFIPMTKARNRLNSSAKGVVCELSQMSIKVYDKGTQYNLDRYLMRFEVKICKVQSIQKKGVPIYYLSDFRNGLVFDKLGDVLLSVHDSILKSSPYDFEKINSLNFRDKELLRNGRSVDYWNNLKNDASKKTYYTRQQKYKKLINEVNISNIHDEVRAKIVSKIKALKSPLIQSTTKLPLFESDFVKKEKLPLICQVNYSDALILSDTQNERKAKNQCIVCGLDVSHRKEKTLTCSKECRNKKSNSYHDSMKKIRKDLNSSILFDVSQMVSFEVLKNKQSSRFLRCVSNA